MGNWVTRVKGNVLAGVPTRHAGVRTPRCVPAKKGTEGQGHAMPISAEEPDRRDVEASRTDRRF